MRSSTSSEAQARRDRGQAAVELALTLPLLCLLLLGVVQVAVVTRAHLAVQLAAREAARRAAAGDTPAAAAAAGRAAVALGPLDVRIDVGLDDVTAIVRYVDRTEVPVIGALIPDVDVRASVTMVREDAGRPEGRGADAPTDGTAGP